jgi:GTP-binding protein HflX
LLQQNLLTVLNTVFDRPDIGDQAVLVCLDFGDPDHQENVAECAELVRSANVTVTGIIQGKRQRPDAALFAGKGKVEEVGVMVRATGANVVIFNHQLSPAQERNLERACNAG